jgi:hypothetical protein
MDEVKNFTFLLHFDQNVYLSSAWNGALEIHQNVKKDEKVDTIPDLRDYKPEDYDLVTYTVDGENLVAMKPGDYLKYTPSSSANAMEVPIEPEEGTTPGIILYAPIGQSIEGFTLDLEYKFHRRVTSEPYG